MIIYSLLTIEREANEVFLGVSSREEARVYWFLKIIRFIGHNSCESFPMPCLKELQLSSVSVCMRISREVAWGATGILMRKRQSASEFGCSKKIIIFPSPSGDCGCVTRGILDPCPYRWGHLGVFRKVNFQGLGRSSGAAVVLGGYIKNRKLAVANQGPKQSDDQMSGKRVSGMRHLKTALVALSDRQSTNTIMVISRD